LFLNIIQLNIAKKRDKKLQDVLKDFVDKNIEVKRGFAEIDIEKIYNERMGPVVASYTEKIFLVKDTLYVQIQSAPLRVELLQSKESLRTALNEALGEEIIAYIKIK
jgi:hypothetical protein